MYRHVRIMVAEDLQDLRSEVVQLLVAAGFDVLEASDGCEALELIEHPDGLSLIVTDINMPGFSGFEVAEHARARHPTIPVIFVTGRPEQLAFHGIGQPARCIEKPLRPGLLLEAITEMLDLAKA